MWNDGIWMEFRMQNALQVPSIARDINFFISRGICLIDISCVALNSVQDGIFLFVVILFFFAKFHLSSHTILSGHEGSSNSASLQVPLKIVVH